MLEKKLLHLHPTLEMIAQTLQRNGITCRTEGIPQQRQFRNVCIYQGEQTLSESTLYILPPESASSFPVDQNSYISTTPFPGNAEHLFCPGEDIGKIISLLLHMFNQLQIHENALDDLVFRNAPLQELCEYGAQMLGNPICIHDDWFIMVAMSRDLPDVMPPDYIMSSTKQFIPQAIIDDFKYDTDYLETYAHRSAQRWDALPGTPPCLYVNLWNGDIYQGRLLVVKEHRDFRAEDFMMSEVLTQRASLLLQRQHLGESRSYRSMDDVMYDLLTGKKTDLADENQLLNMMGWDKSDKFTCIRIQNQQNSPTLVTRHVLHSDLFRNFPGSYIMFEGHQQCLILNLTKAPTTLPFLRHTLSPLCRDYCFYAGISSPVFGIRELSIAYHQAEVALNHAFRLQSDRWIIPFSDCALDYMLGCMQTPLEPLHIAAPELRLLIDHDKENGTQYFETLRTYLLMERDIPRASQALIIHRTTLLYRLKKIQAITQVNLDDPEQRLYLTFSLWILEKEIKQRL